MRVTSGWPVRLESCPAGVDPVDYLRELLRKADEEHAENVALISMSRGGRELADQGAAMAQTASMASL